MPAKNRPADGALARTAPVTSLALGAVAAYGFAPYALWPLTLACFALWLALVHDARSLPAVLWRGWLFGVGHFTVGNSWIQRAFTFQDAMPHWLGYVGVVLLALYLAIYPALAAGLAWRLASPRASGDRLTGIGGPFILVAGASWIATEWLRGTMFTGYPWNPLAEIWLPLIGVAGGLAWVGTYALSGLTVVIAGALLLIARRRFWLAAQLLGATALLALNGIAVPVTPVAYPADAPRVRTVQPNLDQEERPRDDYAETNLRALERHSGTPGAAPRLIVWPEGALRYLIEDGYPGDYYTAAPPAAIRARIAALLGPRDIVLTGGNSLKFDAAGNLSAVTNSVFAIDARGTILGRYDKAHLVPWGEYLPARPIMAAIGLSRLVPGDLDFAPGSGPISLNLPEFGPIGYQICYEMIFSGAVVDRANRPRLIFNPSNDSWYARSGPAQHLAQARLRAIEEGLPVVRATPTGISAIIDARGRVVASVPWGATGATEARIPDALPPTLFARLGNGAAALIAALLLAMAVAIRRGAR